MNPPTVPNFAVCHSVLPSWKQFVKGREEEHNLNDSQETRRYELGYTSGAVAKATYEDTIGQEALKSEYTSSVTSQLPVNRKPSFKSPTACHIPSGQTPVNVFMKFAERGDLQSLSSALEKSKDLLNAADGFGWTALMCAACAGSIKVVEFLLTAGADTSVRDKGGSTCLSLARKCGHTDIVSLIWSFNRERRNSFETDANERSMPTGTFYCEACREDVKESLRKEHLTSTVHLLHSHRGKVPTVYGIPEHNRGYQILVKRGWDRECGLGPDGKGKKLPPKTILKNDRKGIGASKLKPRVTHFAAYDVKAVCGTSVQTREMRNRTLNKRQREREANRDRMVERCLRRELS